MSKHSRDPHPVDYVINKYRQYSDAEHSNSWNNAVHRGCDLLEDWLEGEFFDEYTEWTADHLEEYGTWLQRNYDFSDR